MRNILHNTKIYLALWLMLLLICANPVFALEDADLSEDTMAVAEMAADSAVSTNASLPPDTMPADAESPVLAEPIDAKAPAAAEPVQAGHSTTGASQTAANPGTGTETASTDEAAPVAAPDQTPNSLLDDPGPADLKSDLPESTVKTNLLPETRAVSTENDNTLRSAAGSRGNGQPVAEKPLLADNNGLLADKPSLLEVGDNEVLVEAYGVGSTRDKALQAAFMEAIAKVNGTALTNNQVREIQYKLDAAVEMNGNAGLIKTGALENAETATFGYGNQVNFITNGLVKSYEIITEGRVNKDYEVSLRALVVKYTPGVETSRQRIAVMPFRTLDADGWQTLYAGFFTQQLSDALTQTQRFAVLDRTFTSEKQNEFAVLNAADTPVAERVRIGNTLGADYLVVGQINKLDYVLTEEAVPYTKNKQYVLTGRTALTLRVIVPATGQVVMTKTYNEKTELKFDGREDLKLEDLEQTEIDRLAAAAADKACRDIMGEMYPILAIAHDGNEFIVNQGGDSLKTGQQYNLRVYGEMLVDPYTKEELGRAEKTIGSVEITEVMSRYARAKTLALDAGDDLDLLVKAGMVILRPVAETVPAKAVPPPPTTNRPKW